MLPASGPPLALTTTPNNRFHSTMPFCSIPARARPTSTSTWTCLNWHRHRQLGAHGRPLVDRSRAIPGRAGDNWSCSSNGSHRHTKDFLLGPLRGSSSHRPSGAVPAFGVAGSQGLQICSAFAPGQYGGELPANAESDAHRQGSGARGNIDNTIGTTPADPRDRSSHCCAIPKGAARHSRQRNSTSDRGVPDRSWQPRTTRPGIPRCNRSCTFPQKRQDPAAPLA